MLIRNACALASHMQVKHNYDGLFNKHSFDGSCLRFHSINVQ